MILDQHAERPPVSSATDGEVENLLHEATRALLWVESAIDARRLVESVVIAMGGTVEPAISAGPDAISIDVSFGAGQPALPSAGRGSRARVLLEHHLPTLVLDARRAVEIGLRADRLADEASIDSLTRLPNRRMLGRALGRVHPGDVVIMLDLDHFKKINDTIGHDAGDAVLRAFGATLLATVRERDSVGRYGGEEFVVILHDGGDADAFLHRLRTLWESDRPHALTFSAGVAIVRLDALLALRAADQAMYRAKAGGRNRAIWASDTDYSDEEPTLDTTEHADQVADTPVQAADTNERRTSFVAFSQISVADDGREALEDAFADRLGEVDHWPGFRSLEVWADLADPTSYAMVSWWDSADAFRGYMQSDDHRRSHDRIPTGDGRPSARGFRRFRVIAT